MRFYVTVKLGPNREKFGPGYLICRNVPFARTGDQIYGPGQTPIEAGPGPDGLVVISRSPEEVFRPETIDSFNGMPLTIDHPPVDVTPENWAQYAAGIVFNVRRGKGSEDDLLIADILVTDAEAIRLIEEDELDELSAGYDAGYEQTAPGRGNQVDIMGNHVALVKKARCGSRCSIQDSIPGGDMPVEKVVKVGALARVRDSIMAAFKAKDEDELKKALDAAEAEESGGGNDTHIHINHEASKTDDEVDSRLAALEAAHEELKARVTDCEANLPKKTTDAEEEEKKKAEEEEAKKTEDELKEEAPEGTGDEAFKAKDSAFMSESYQSTVSAAEILAPGIKFPVFDSASNPKATLDSLTAFRRKALGIASATPVGATLIAELRGGRAVTHDSLQSMSHGEVRTLFTSAAVAMRQYNSAASSHTATRTADSATTPKAVRSVADANRVNADFWK